MQKANTLFRTEAIEGQKKKLLGEAMILPRTNHAILTSFLVIWFVLLCVLLINAKFSSKANVRGWLVSSKPSIDIFSKERSGTLTSIKVINGQHVSKGQTLATVLRFQSALVDDAIRKQQYESLNQQFQLLQKRKQILTQKHEQQLSLKEELHRSYQRKMTAMQQQEKSMTSQLKENLLQELALFRLLERKSITQLNYDGQKEKRRTSELRLSQQRSAKIDLEQAISSNQHNRKNIEIEFDESINLLNSNFESIKQKIADFNGASSYQIKSPTNGLVQNLQATLGQTLNTAVPLMQITQKNNPLKAILYIPSNHSGFIQRMQSVQLKLAAFPYQKFGMASAQVSHISQNILLPSQVHQAPFALSEPVFLIEASLIEQTIEANGKDIELKPGMLFQADIKLSQRGLWEWLLNPIYSLRGNA